MDGGHAGTFNFELSALKIVEQAGRLFNFRRDRRSRRSGGRIWVLPP